VVRDLSSRAGQAAFRACVDRLRDYFLTQDGAPRGGRFAGTGFRATDCVSDAAWRHHRAVAAAVAPAIADVIYGFRRDLNVVVSRGVYRVFGVALSQYRRTLDARAQLDFSGVLERAVDLLSQMDEFARSRYRLESRYRHVLVDEFQDTSRVQWDLVAQLVRSWGEGLGASADALPPSIFIVGDRKQSIYRFRDADAGLLDEAARFISALRPEGEPRRAISVSFRSAQPLLAFVNDLFNEVAAEAAPHAGPSTFTYADRDRFPLIEDSNDRLASEPLGLVVGSTVRHAAEAVAAEIVELLGGAIVRDKVSGLPRPAQPADIAILFRSRESHREFESALERRGVQTYVYKGLGFFEADEIQDAMALLRFLADPTSNLRAAAFLRSRFVRLSDDAIMRLAPDLAAAITGEPVATTRKCDLSTEDRTVLDLLQSSVARWLTWVDLVTPAELLDAVLHEAAYAMEVRGARRLQARENLKKLRGLIRRIQNRGYATLGRIASYLDRLAIGDESNAAIDASDAVSLMTIHAAKGLEFPIVFLVNIGRGAGGVRAPIRVTASDDGHAEVAVADFESEADEQSPAREREETKRLLYVAFTRARDRLYLSTTVHDGACRAGRGSLGEVMPPALLALFVEAARARNGDRLVWRTPHGRAHLFAIRNQSSPKSEV
jgi:ATP-dependent helicase/nuclease subunit A